MPKKCTSALWNFFKRHHGTKLGTCNYCGQNFSYKSTTTNLTQHLKSRHKNVYDEYYRCKKAAINITANEISQSEKNYENLVSDKINPEVWKYFQKAFYNDSFIAVCNLCQMRLSFKSSITLKQHLRFKHEKAFKDIKAETLANQNDDSDNQNGFEGEHSVKVECESDSNTSTTWGYFEKERGKVRCLLCRAFLASEEASTDELRRHLNEKHPDLDENDQNSDNEQEREIDGDIFTEVIYLEDENPRKTAKRQRISKTAHLEPTPRAFTRKRTKLIKRNDSTSSDEVLVKGKKSEDEEIEKFAKYIACLLKTVPKDVSTKLQMEIVSLIMSAKLKIQEKPENPVAGPSYILTVPSTSVVESNSDTKRDEANDTIVTVPVTVSSSLSNEFYTIHNLSENK